MELIVTYHCSGINKVKDVLKFCTESFYATLDNPKRALKFKSLLLQQGQMERKRT